MRHPEAVFCSAPPPFLAQFLPPSIPVRAFRRAAVRLHRARCLDENIWNYRPLQRVWRENTLMPLYSFHCKKCDKESEILAGFDEAPPCPACGSTRMERLPSRPAPPLTYKSYQRKMRAQAVKEGDASNFSREEQTKFKA
jgi:putative FmdB family regulatory protein